MSQPTWPPQRTRTAIGSRRPPRFPDVRDRVGLAPPVSGLPVQVERLAVVLDGEWQLARVGEDRTEAAVQVGVLRGIAEGGVDVLGPRSA